MLALLPADKIIEGYQYIKEVIEKYFPNNGKWKKFCGYYERQWIKKTKVATFSVYKVIDRTNNYLESYHRTLNEILRAKPSLRALLSKYTF